MYRDPADPQYQQYAQYNPYWQPVHVFDMDGDGLLDLSANFSGRWRNRGDGSFERWSDGLPSAQSCVMSIDFNGDQRADCLVPALNPADQALYLDDTTKVARFNLTGTADSLFVKDGNNVQTTGVVTEDIDGDGRQDILRWSATTANNGVYLSNGDGSFRAIQGAALNLSADPLMTTDGTRTFITGDFLGNGSLQVMLLRQDARPSLSTGWRNIVMPAQSNALLHLSGDRSPIDHLTRVTTGSGVVFQVTGREPITTSGNYTSDRGKPGLAATGQQVDLQPPSYVITSTTKSSPGFEAVQTRYSYHGLKAERNGRGMLGFRETRQQTKAPDGRDLTVVTRNLLGHPYIGVAGVTETFVGAMDLSGQRLSRTTYSYCDKTSQVAPSDIESGGTAPVPCSTVDKVQRPYLHQSLEEGWDLDSGIALPTVRTTNSYNGYGDPLTIEVVTRGTALGVDQAFTKKVVNAYAPPVTAADRWILGRLTTATVTQAAPNSLNSISTSAGSAPRATDRNGTGDFVLGAFEVPAIAPQTLNETVLIQATLRNTSNAAQSISSIAVTNSSGAAFGLQSHGCPANLEPARGCTININFRPTAVQTFRGSVSARVGSALIEKNLQGDGSPLSVSPTNFGPVAMGSSLTRDVAVRNAGNSPLSIQVPAPTSVTGIGFSFESTTCTGTLDALGTCSIKVRASPSSTGTRDGQVTVRTVSGTAASATVSATGINVSMSNVDFGFVKTGQSKAASVTVGNNSSVEVTITSGVNLTGSAISIANTSTCTLNKVLRLNESCRIDLVFAPNSVGDYSGNVSLDTSAGNLRSTWTGSAPAWGFDGIQFGRVATREDAVLASTTLYNNGSSPIVFDSPFNFGVAIVPNGTAEFFYAGTTCGAQLDPGANCSVSVSFKPTLTTLQTAELRIRGNSKLMSAAITGTGVAVSLGNLQFGLREPNASNLGWHAQVQNSSNSAINIGAVTISGNGAFTLFTPTNPSYPPCGSSLGANASCFLGVRYRPTTVGDEQAAEIVVNSSVGGLRSYLAGSTKAWATATTFPSTRVGFESPDQQITIANRSGAALTLPTNIGALIVAPFIYQSTTCGSSLANGSDCKVTARFKPTAIGTKSLNAILSTNLGNITMTLSGTGL